VLNFSLIPSQDVLSVAPVIVGVNVNVVTVAVVPVRSQVAVIAVDSSDLYKAQVENCRSFPLISVLASLTFTVTAVAVPKSTGMSPRR